MLFLVLLPIWLTIINKILGALFDYHIYVFLKGHNVVIFLCLKDETPHKQHVKEKFSE